MNSIQRRAVGAISICGIFIYGGTILMRSGATPAQEKAAATKTPGSPGGIADAYRFNTLGVAYMNQQRPADAQKYFEQALAADAKFYVARLNLGVSLLGQQKLEAARAALAAAAEQLPKDPYAWYNLGLAYKDLGDAEKGIGAFQHVTEIGPNEPDAYYFVGYLNSQIQKYDEAIAAFQKGLALAPYHASAEFGLARALQRKGDSAAAREHLARFQKITSEHLGVPFGAGYGDQGKYSLAELPLSTVADVPAAIPVRYTAQANAFVAKSNGGNHMAIGPSTGACFLDFDGDGKADLFLVSGAADGTSRLLRNLGDGRFDDVTQEAGIREEKGCVGVTFVDYDHDEDLDLYVTMAPEASSSGAPRHNILWRNNGNRTFTDVSAETALGFAATGAGVVSTDFNNDRAIDFVVAGGPEGASIYLNPREGKFTPLTGIDFNREKLPPAVGVVAFDFDKDGWMDLAFTHAGAPGISLWRNVEGKRLQRVTLPELGWQKGWGLAALDYDNDGWLDLVAAGESSGGGEIRLLRNLGSKGWADVTKDVHLNAVKLNQPRAIAVADIAGNGDADLVVTQLGGGPIVLRN